LNIADGVLGWLFFTLAGFALALLLPLKFLLVLLCYLVITNVYSFRLKRVIMLDVVVLAGLYTIRLIGGSEAIDVPLSFWLLAFSMFLFLSLALIKRYSEIMSMELRGDVEASGRGYSVNDKWVIGQLGVTSGLISILVLALYINSSSIEQLYREPRFIWMLCPLIMYWIGRMWLLASRGEVDEDPVVFAAKDRRSALVALLCGIVVVLAI
jgi:4-hydroxybenzoate polyprenyltransferase